MKWRDSESNLASKPIALDLFCGAGGTTKGLQRAGFYVVGVDIKPQPRYCGDLFVQGDALRPPLDLARFDFIWASPPCQAHTSLKSSWNAKQHTDRIPETRSLLQATSVPYAIENVVGAPLKSSIMLCGTQFGLGHQDAELWRHRHFECSFPVPLKFCRHGERNRVIGVYGGHGRDRRRKVNAQDYPAAARREAMGIDWMTDMQLSQAIPPAYSEFIGRAALQYMKAEVA